MTTAEVKTEIEAGRSAYDIARSYGVTPSAVYYHMNKFDTPRRHVKFDPKKHPVINGKRWPEYEAYIGAKGWQQLPINLWKSRYFIGEISLQKLLPN